MAKELICVLDLGSFSIKSLLVKKENDHFSFVSKKETISEGIKEGNILFIEKCRKAVEKNLDLLEKEQKSKIEKVIVSLNGTFLSCFKNRALISVSRSDGIISEEDIERVNKEAQISKDSFNKEIVEVLEEKFFVDNQVYFEKPLGLRATKLEKEILGIEVLSSYLKTFKEAFFSSDFEVDDFVSFPLALSKIPSDKEKEIGVLVVDFGHQTTSFCLIKDREIIDFFVLPFGSCEINKEIALNLKISYESAEQIKCEYGDAYFRGKDKKEKLEIEDGNIFLSQKRLSQIIQKVLWEIFRQPLLNLKQTLKNYKMAGGIIFVGGGAKIKNFGEFLRHKFPFYVKMKNYSKIEGMENDFSFAKTEGMVLSLLGRDLSEEKFSVKIKKLFKKIF